MGAVESEAEEEEKEEGVRGSVVGKMSLPVGGGVDGGEETEVRVGGEAGEGEGGVGAMTKMLVCWVVVVVANDSSGGGKEAGPPGGRGGDEGGGEGGVSVRELDGVGSMAGEDEGRPVWEADGGACLLTEELVVVVPLTEVRTRETAPER